MASPCSATTYCMAAEICCGFHSHRVLPRRAHRFRLARVASFGKLIGPPWTQDQKFAAVAALMALGDG
jgi:hypothetical protein